MPISDQSYTSAKCDQSLLGCTIGDMFDQTVQRYPNNEALVVCHQNIRWTYREINISAASDRVLKQVQLI